MIDGGTIGQNLSHFHRLPKSHHWRLRDGRTLIRSLELDQIVHVQAGIVPFPTFFLSGTHNDPRGIHAFHDTGTLGLYDIPRITRDHSFHSCTD